MLIALYVIEALLAGGLGAALAAGGLWLYGLARSVPVPLPLWLPVVTWVACFTLRWGQVVRPVPRVRGWHEAIRRRMAERQP